MKEEISPLTCSAEELYSVVARPNKKWLLLCLSNPAMTEDHIIALLRNPSIHAGIVRSIAENPEWLKSHKIQFSIVNCPKTPFPLAMRLLSFLFWNDLAKICANYRLSPPLRRTAERHLMEKSSAMTPGEKKTLCRSAPRNLLPLLRKEKNSDVFSALLQNPRMIEEDVMNVIRDERTPPAILEIIAADRKWSNRNTVQMAIVQNAKTPLAIALSFLSRLRKPDLEALVDSPDSTELIRAAAERILSGEY